MMTSFAKSKIIKEKLGSVWFNFLKLKDNRNSVFNNIESAASYLHALQDIALKLEWNLVRDKNSPHWKIPFVYTHFEKGKDKETTLYCEFYIAHEIELRNTNHSRVHY